MTTKALPRKTRFKLALVAAASSVSQWAKENEVSRTHLYAVLDGAREPSTKLAAKIESVLRRSAA